MYDTHQMMIVHYIQFNKQVKIACCTMTFHDFRNLLKLLGYTVEIIWIFQMQSDIGTSFITNLFWIENKL